MNEGRAKRKLTAILSADVKGYSRLMGEDELATVETLKKYRGMIFTLTEQYRGRVVDSPGDNILSEFSSVVDAVECAVKIQEDLKTQNKELPENRKMEFRIGVNLGDVVEDDGRIYGDGVNIAARIEGLADGGGVCISRMAFDSVRNKLNLGYEYLGEHEVKNISEPVRVYKVLVEPEHAGKVVGEERPKKKNWRWAAIAIVFIVIVGGLLTWNFYLKRPSFEPASVDRMAFPLPDKPSIAVLPFDNLSGNPDQEYLADGISETIISALSKVSEMFVIDPNSTFNYKNKPVKIKQVSEELGVMYVLKGSVQREGDRVRITAQLIDAINGHHLWAEHYDRGMKSFFELQDEITIKILTSLRIQLTEGETARIWGDKTKNLGAYLKQVEANSLWRKGSKESIMRFGQIGRELIEMAPEYPIGYSTLAWYHWWLVRNGMSSSPQESIAEAFTLSKKVLSLDDSNPHAYSLMGSLYLTMRQHEKAIAAGKRSVELDPNGGFVHGLLGFTLTYAGRVDEAIYHLKQGIRLNPFPAYWYYRSLSTCYMLSGQYKEALMEVKKALHLSPNALSNHVSLAVVYVLLDREEEAHTAVKKVMMINPTFSVDRIIKTIPFRNNETTKFFVNLMYKAGFK